MLVNSANIITNILLPTDLPRNGNTSGTIACQKRESHKIALSYKTTLKERLARLKLHCLNSSYKLGLKVPFSQKRTKTENLPINILLNFMILDMNQMSNVRNYKKHGVLNSVNVTNGKPKKATKLLYVNIQAPKFLTQKYGAGAPQVSRFNLIKPI